MPMNMDGEVGQVWDLWIIRTDCFKQSVEPRLSIESKLLKFCSVEGLWTKVVHSKSYINQCMF